IRDRNVTGVQTRALPIYPETAAITLQALGADALGVNCSLGPAETVPIVARMAAVTRTPLIVQPNAGMPRMENGRTLYDVTPEARSEERRGGKESGARRTG